MPQLETALGASQEAALATGATGASTDSTAAVTAQQRTDPDQEYVSLGTVASIIEKLQILWKQNEAADSQGTRARSPLSFLWLTGVVRDSLAAERRVQSADPFPVLFPISFLRSSAIIQEFL
jgi:hypothetical protein